MADTPRWGLPHPGGSDEPDGPAQIEALALALDGVAMDDQGLAANRPVSTSGTPGKRGRYYKSTDTGALERDNGMGWDPVGSIPYGTAFPTSGLFNGYRFTYADSDVLQDYIYRTDLDATYPWHFLGGQTIQSFVATPGSMGSASGGFATFGTPVSIVIPFAGVYDIEIGADLSVTWAGTVAYLSPNGCGLTAGSTTAASITSDASDNSSASVESLAAASVFRRLHAEALTAATLSLYREWTSTSGHGGASSCANALLSATPRKVSG